MSQPIYVINLPEATDRLSHTQKQLQTVGLSASVIAGIKGTELSNDDITQQYSAALNKQFFRRALSKGEIGCYLSHRKAWQQMQQNNQPWALFLEDDIEVTPHLPASLAAIHKIADFDLIKLSDNRSLSPARQLQLDDTFSLASYGKMPNCANAYILSSSGAQKLLAREKFFRPVDIDFQFYRELDLSVMGLLPYPIVKSYNFESQICELGRGQEKKETLPWRNWRYRMHIAWQRFRYTSANLDMHIHNSLINNSPINNSPKD